MEFSKEIQSLIASLRGIPSDRNYRATRPSKSIFDLLSSGLKKYKIGEIRPEALIMGQWKEIVGPSFAHRCSPKTITADGTLIIQTSNSTIKNELLFNQSKILKQIQNIEGCKNIKRVLIKEG